MLTRLENVAERQSAELARLRAVEAAARAALQDIDSMIAGAMGSPGNAA